MGKIRMLVLGLALIAPAGAAEIGFWDQLTPAERRAAGLDHLTPEQRAALNRLAERFLRPGPAAPAAVSEQAGTEVRAEVKQELPAEEKARATAKAGRAAAAADATVISSHLVDPFNGWSGATVFRLENGQVWVQENSSDRYWVPTMANAEVELRASKLGGWKLYLKANGAWLRVRRLQ